MDHPGALDHPLVAGGYLHLDVAAQTLDLHVHIIEGHAADGGTDHGCAGGNTALRRPPGGAPSRAMGQALRWPAAWPGGDTGLVAVKWRE